MSEELRTRFHSLDLEGTGKQFISGTYELKIFSTTKNDIIKKVIQIIRETIDNNNSILK